jgi:rhamnose transport system permease protein
MSRYKRELSVALAYGLLLASLWLWAPMFYDQGKEPSDIIVRSAPVLVLAVGMTLVILARHIDISIGSQFSLCGVADGLLAQAGLPMPLVVLGTLLTGAGFGAINGALIA